MSEQARIEEALACIPPHDRETWVRMGMGIKSELGEEGFDLWESWSQGAESFKPADARSVWKGISPNGRVTIGTVFHEAKQNGYTATGNYRRPSPAELERLRKERETRNAAIAAEEARKRLEAKVQANEIWAHCAPVADHAYLTVKGIKAHAARLYRGALVIGKDNPMKCDGSLVVPIRDTSGELHTLEFINPQGEKRYLPNGAKSGNYCAIGKPSGRIIIAEGYATGASAHEAIGHAVAVAFDAQNLEPVAVAIREKYPELEIIIAADNDEPTVCKRHKEEGVLVAVSPLDVRPEWCRCNPGLTQGLRAARAVGGKLAFPEFSAEERDGGATDFNDLSKLRGSEEIERQIRLDPKPRGLLSVLSVPTPALSEEIKTIPEPLPSLPNVQPLNFDALPPVLRGFIHDIAERMQCPPDFPAVACIAMVGAAIGRKVGLRPKRSDNWTVIANQWAMIVGKSGIMKSPAMSAALAPLRKMQAEAFEAHKAALQDHDVQAKLAKINAEAADKKAKALVAKGDNAQAAAILKASQGEDEAPTARRYIVNDSTVEALAETLEENQNGLLVDRDELAGWLRSLDKEGQQEARAFYLTAADGDKGFTTDRIGRGRGRHIPAVCVSIVGGIQPGVLASYVRETQRGGSGDDGLLQRFGLAVYPDISAKWRNVDRAPDLLARKAIDALLVRLCSLEPEEIGAELDEYQTIPFLRFDAAAQAMFDEWRAELEQRIRGDDEHPSMVSHLSKYRKLVPGLALINHLAEGGSGPVAEQALARALMFSEYLESHARRIYSYASRPDVDAAKTILSKIRAGKIPVRFKARDVYRNGWSGLATQEETWPAIRLLKDYGYVMEAEENDTGGRPSQSFIAHPSIKGAA
jgi:putative DNA primase/helicase